MNWFQFLGLIRDIYGGKKHPDLEAIQRKGLLAVKIAQVHALRIDFLDEEKCRHLARLYRNTVRIPPERFDALLASAAPLGFADHFASIDPAALASASIGQVHRARLKSGDDVVVKIIKKDFRRNFERDVASLKKLFRIFIFLYPKLARVADPVGIIEDIEEYTLSELDLRNEMEGQRTLRRIYEENRHRYDLSHLVFPVIHESLSNQNIMVSEYIGGKTIDELLEAGEFAYEDLLRLFAVQGFYIFGVGTFHGDLHPGNVILHNGKICFVDTGFVGHVGKKLRKGLFRFFESLSAYDYDRCAHYLNQMAEREITGRAFEEFHRRFLELYREYTNSTVSQVSLTRKMMETIKLGVHSGMTFEKGMFPIIRSLMYMDGMVLRCNPEAVLVRDMRRFIGELEKFVPDS